MAEMMYCYHCRAHHPKEEMRRLDTKTGIRWRCIRSIEATKRSLDAREAYGKEISALNRANARAKAQMMQGVAAEKRRLAGTTGV